MTLLTWFIFSIIFYIKYDEGLIEPSLESNSKTYQDSARYIPPEVKREVWRRDKGRCIMCGSNQWLEYDNAYKAWYLAIPVESKEEAQELIRQNNIQNCNIITWQRNDNSTYTFWGLPGLEK